MIDNLTIIGEAINASIPSTNKLFEENNYNGIIELAASQAENGAAYIDVNVGNRSREFMEMLVKRIQNKIVKPLSIDTPDYETARSGLLAYNPAKAGGSIPVLNSISPLRMEMFELYREKPFCPVLMVSERTEGGQPKANTTAEETYGTVKEMIEHIRKNNYNIPMEQIIIDTGIAPIGTDMEGMLKRVIESIKLIYSDPALEGIHTCVGLSNFTVMLPPKCADGTPVKSSLESAFLSLVMPLGFDTIIGSVKRKYQILPGDHPAMTCLKDVMTKTGYETIARVIAYYS